MRSMDVKGFARAFGIPISWLSRKPNKNEFTATVEKVEVAIHINSLKARLRLPLHSFGMQFLIWEIITPAQLHSNG